MGDQELLRQVIPARLDQVDESCALMRETLTREGLGSLIFDMELLLREVLTNAVEHGCGGCEDCQVEFILSREGACLVLDVRDEGEGFFQENQFSSPGLPEAESESGRGRSIIENYTDDFYYFPPGNRVILKKKIQEVAGMSGLEITKSDQRADIKMTQDLVASRSAEVKQELKALVDEGIREVVMDFSQVEMVDSAGIGVLVALQNSLKKQEGGLCVKKLSPDLMDLFKTMRLDYHFQIEGD